MRLKIHVEGQTEQRFVKSILSPFLSDIGYETITITNRTSQTQRGGLSRYAQFRKNTLRLKEQNPCLITTMIDFYHLPKDFPGKDQIADITNPHDKVLHLEEQFKADIPELSPYFIPYIQLHEFEALLFSDTNAIEEVIGADNPSMQQELRKIMQTHREPENINTEKGPSKHLMEICADYRKTFHGLGIAEKIDLETMRERCPHFSQWLKQLELFPRE